MNQQTTVVGRARRLTHVPRSRMLACAMMAAVPIIRSQLRQRSILRRFPLAVVGWEPTSRIDPVVLVGETNSCDWLLSAIKSAKKAPCDMNGVFQYVIAIPPKTAQPP